MANASKTTRAKTKKTPAKRAAATKKEATKKKAAKKKPAKKKAAAKSEEVTIDRRRGDRRQEEKPVAAKLERRAKTPRRRQIDPTTCERDYSNDEIEFMNALDEYKRKNGRMFPTCSEVLEVIRDLGYRKHTEPAVESAEPAAPGMPLLGDDSLEEDSSTGDMGDVESYPGALL